MRISLSKNSEETIEDIGFDLDEEPKKKKKLPETEEKEDVDDSFFKNFV